MNDLDQIICNDYKVGRISSVTRKNTQPYPYTIDMILLYVKYIVFKITLITLCFHTIDNIKL